MKRIITWICLLTIQALSLAQEGGLMSGGAEGSGGDSGTTSATGSRPVIDPMAFSVTQWGVLLAITVLGAYAIGTLVFLWKKNNSRPAKAGGCGCLAGVAGMILLQIVLAMAFGFSFANLVPK